MIGRKLFIALTFVILSIAPVSADEMADCTGKDIVLKLKSCSRLINGGKFQGPQLAVLLNNRGMMFVMIGETEKAIEDFDTAIDLDPKFANAYGNRGHALIFMIEFPAALRDFNKAIALQPGDDMNYAGRATVFILTGDLKAAHADLSHAIRINPKNIGAYTSRGTVNRMMQDVFAAISDFKMVLKLDPNDENAKGNLDELLYSAGAGAEAALSKKGPGTPKPKVAIRAGTTKLTVVWAR